MHGRRPCSSMHGWLHAIQFACLPLRGPDKFGLSASQLLSTYRLLVSAV